ncbi:MAG TPA: phosphatase PAP2 family protein [Candidatus Acetothermia bacterium]|nr:phosphatase PAP2 family protein [Candidatus Acetothermia bacterium]
MSMLWRAIGRVDALIDALLRWDEQTLQAISENPRLNPMSKLLVSATYMGDGYLWGGLALGLILFGRPIDRSYIILGIGVMIASIAIFRMFKMVFARPRPILVVSPFRSKFLDSYSFPSGHATTSFALAWVISVCYPHLWVQIAIYLAAITISLSRVYMREHYPLDVICGALLGTFIAIYLLPLLERIVF